MGHTVFAGLQDPNRAFLVLLGGLLLIYRECLSPGRVIPGIAGGVLVIISGYALLRHPWTWMGAVLLCAGAGLLVLQGFHRWFWIPGIAGAGCLTLGAMRLLIIPTIKPLYAAASIPFSAITAFLIRTAVRARRNKLAAE